MVQLIQIQIAQQGADNRSLRRARDRRPLIHAVQNLCLQKLLDQSNHRVVGNVLAQFLDQAIMRNGVKVRFQINIHRVFVTGFHKTIHATQRVFTSSIGTKAVAVFRELPFKYRLQHMAKCVLHDAISHRGNAQRASFICARFRDVNTLDRLRCVCSIPQLLFKLRHVPIQSCREISDCDIVHARCALVRSDLAVSRIQVVRFVDFIHQAMPFPSSNA